MPAIPLAPPQQGGLHDCQNDVQFLHPDQISDGCQAIKKVSRFYS